MAHSWGSAALRRAGVLAAALCVSALVGPVGVARAAVPTPAADTSVVTVAVRGDRIATGTGADAVAPLAGVQLGLFASATATTPINATWALCVSDADGDCSFVVPDTGPGGANQAITPFVRQLAAPAGWFANLDLRTGPANGSGSQDSVYQFQTPALQGGTTYASTSSFMFSTSNSLTTSSLGLWQNSRNNPALATGCGVSVALVLDLSASVGSRLPLLKGAADTLADSLVGTPSRMAVFSFSATSPSAGADANHPDLVSVSTQAGADAFKAQYADWQIASGTNWDQGLFQVAQAAPRYQLVIVLTDGNPDRYSVDPLQGNGSTTHFRDVEAGIFSANAVKAKGSRVIAVGVGTGTAGLTALNLAAISGPVAFDGTNSATADYYQTADFVEAGAALRELALSRCDGTLSVVKQLVPAGTTGEDVTGAQPATAGWQFQATSSTPGIGGVPASGTTVADGTGSVSFALQYPAGTDTAAASVAETQHTDFALVTQGGANAVCTDLDTGTTVPVGNVGTTGFTVDVPRTAAISCTVYDRPEALTPSPSGPAPSPSGVTPPGELPTTGAPLALLVVAGVGLGLAGTLARLANRRRRSP
jgi:hypothetical protein